MVCEISDDGNVYIGVTYGYELAFCQWNDLAECWPISNFINESSWTCESLLQQCIDYGALYIGVTEYGAELGCPDGIRIGGDDL
jgi:hypothetical protein